MVKRKDTARRWREKVLKSARKIAAEYGLDVEFLGDAMSVGVGGDDRTYTPVLVLIGPHPGDEQLSQLSTKLTNELPVNRVTFELKHV